MCELEFLLEAKQIETKIESGETGTITHEELKRLIIEKRVLGVPAHVGT